MEAALSDCVSAAMQSSKPAQVASIIIGSYALSKASRPLGRHGAAAVAALKLLRGEPRAAWAAAAAVVEFAGWLWPARTTFDERTRREWAEATLAVARGGAAYNVGAGTTVERVSRDGVVLRTSLDASRSNFLASMHGGAIASLVDVATTVALVGRGGFPGASVSLDATYLAGCGPGDAVLAEATVLRAGRTLAFTECVLRRERDGAVMARACRVAGRDLSTKPAAFEKTAVEPDTGLGRDDAGKRAYFAHFGDGTYAFQGWDRHLAGALTLTKPYVDDAHPVEWGMEVTKAHGNSFGALHGGCAASLVDVLGSAVVAMGDAYECGVAVALDVHYAAPAKVGAILRWTATAAKRGGRLVTVDVKARCARTDRLVCYGSVTKSLRGLAKQAAKAGNA
ncbi:acyl-CoA hydrolase [Aureococcus anophagefferens]|uniref:Acyl-CoA hydrolase n=1 Tax=Aureococcus anophagefferens TaxID=44056 RepID=A0ABR1G7Q8_AURAN